MKIIQLHQNQKPVFINTENIETYCVNSDNGKVNLITNFRKGTRLEVDETLFEINSKIEGNSNGH